MRIISGIYARRRLRTPKNLRLRPTTDQAKEGLFNILANRYYFDELKVLDLFAGTGNIGFEFVSRGAISVTAVENNLVHFKFITSVKKDLEMETLEPYKADVFKFLAYNTRIFDIVFADPPYDMPEVDQIPNAIFADKLLSEHGVFILEHSSNHDFSTHANFKELRKYGKVHFSFFETNP